MSSYTYNIFADNFTGINSNTHFLALDFITNNAVSNNFSLSAAGGGNFNQIDGETNRDGLVSFNIINNINSRIGIAMATDAIGNFLDQTERFVEFEFAVSATSDAGIDQYYIACGFLQNSSSVVGNDHSISILYDPDNCTGLNAGGITNFLLYTRDAGTFGDNVVDTGVPLVPNTYIKLAIQVVGGNINVYIDNDLVVTDTNIPTFSIGTNKLTLGMHFNRNGVFSSTTKNLFLDKFRTYNKNLS